jgi:hypothetical protein
MASEPEYLSHYGDTAIGWIDLRQRPWSMRPKWLCSAHILLLSGYRRLISQRVKLPMCGDHPHPVPRLKASLLPLSVHDLELNYEQGQSHPFNLHQWQCRLPQAVPLMTCIREIAVRISAETQTKLTEVFRVMSQSLHANVGISTLVRPWSPYNVLCRIDPLLSSGCVNSGLC